ncbi:MAG: N-acetyl-gamma-glutamyl-phosphate reductase, partial [Muribaculaceae bacterium]|nr:N-acetyl-gamma-glutamyl-phosphate reductase [Muribaculaceae bacterium]
MIRAGILGGDGFAAGELIRLLINHPDVELSRVHSRLHAGKLLTEVHQG